MIADILPGNLWFIIKILPLLAVTALLFGMFGWWLRRKFHAPVVSSSKPAPQDDLPARERVRKLENALAKSEAAQKALKHDLETLQAKTVAKQTLEKAARDLADAQHRLESDQKRIQALEADLKKTRETLNTLNSNAAEANKGQRERTFALENELSKTREALAVLQARPDNSLTLQAEVDRLRETLTNSTRVIGELRKQEAATAQALAKCQAQLEAATKKATPPPAEAVSLLPAMELAERRSNKVLVAGSKVAGAKEEVARLQALNAQKEAERLAAEQAAAQQAEQERLAAEQAAAQQAEQERLAAEQAAAQKAEKERLAAEQAAAQQAEQERLAAEQAAAQQAEQERLAAEQAAAQQAEQERLAAEQATAQQAEQAIAEEAEEKPLVVEMVEPALPADEQVVAQQEEQKPQASATPAVPQDAPIA